MADRRRPPAPRYNAIVASAAVMTQRPPSLQRTVRSEQWQDEAWGFYDTCGELRFGIGWVANGLSRVNLVAAHQPQQQGDEPSAIEEPAEEDEEAEPLSPTEVQVIELVQGIAGGVGGQTQMMSSLATLLSVAGLGWVLIESEAPVEPSEIVEQPFDAPTPTPDETWVWHVLSNEEIRTETGVWQVAKASGEWRDLNPDHVLIKVWRSHPRRSWEPDSPCRAVLPTLRQIAMLDEHVIATAQSRLAGAGLLLLPTEVEFKPLVVRINTVEPVEGEVVEDDFTDTLIDTMTTPIGDRGSAAAVVPLTARIPGEYVDKVRHVTFWSEFSEAILPLREGAIKRLALGLDMPPEVLTGVAGVNHWTAWQVEETAITLHLEPLAEVICHALTIGYLHPVLQTNGVTDFADYMVFYDTTDLTTRPDRSEDAFAAYDRIELSGIALRREAGLSELDAPSEEERAYRIALRLLDAAPTMADDLLPYLGVKDLEVTPPAAPGQPPATEPAEGEEGPPEQETGGEPEAVAASVVMEACDALVHRALEKTGVRLRSAAGRKVNGGAGAVNCPDVTKLHTQISVSSFARLDDLMKGVWDRVPSVAPRLGLDADTLTLALDAYVRSLLATGHAHDSDRLSEALGLAVAV